MIRYQVSGCHTVKGACHGVNGMKEGREADRGEKALRRGRAAVCVDAVCMYGQADRGCRRMPDATKATLHSGPWGDSQLQDILNEC